MPEITMDAAKVDFINGGKAYGSIAERLLANNLNINSLRNNDTLLYDEWKQIDRAVLQGFKLRTTGVKDLMSRNLSYSFDGMAKTVLQYQTQSDITGAELTMDGVSKGQKDRPTYASVYLPLPITFKDFSYSIREISESRNGNMPLDTTTAELAGMKVAEKVEDMLFNGVSAYTYGGGTIYGYLDYPNRNTASLGTSWASDTGENILADVRTMKQALLDDRCYGPYMLYIPGNYETKMDADYIGTYGKTIRQRILEVDGIQGVKVSDYLPDDNVMMIQLTSNVVRMIEGLAVKPVQWESDGGFRVNFKVLTIMVPQLRADSDNRCGIVHMS